MSEDDNTIELNRRRVLSGLGVIGAAGAASGAGTMALFSDTETSNGNSVQAGTLDLQTSSESTVSVPAAGLAPGETSSGSVDLEMGGSLSGNHVEVALGDVTQSDNGSAATSEYDANLTADEFDDRVRLIGLGYGNGYANSRDWWHDLMPPVQLPGVFVINNDTGGVGTGVTVNSASPGIHVTSNGSSVNNYVHILQDVSTTGLTLSGMADGDINYKGKKGGSSTARLDDEVKVIAKSSDGDTLYFWKQPGDDEQSSVSNGFTQFDLSTTGWNKVNIGTGEWTGGHNLTNYSGNVKLFGYGIGTITSTTDYTFNLRFKDLNVKSNDISLRHRAPSIDELKNRSYIVDNLRVPTSGSPQTLDFVVKLDMGVGNDFQADGIEFDVDVALAQESGQDVL